MSENPVDFFRSFNRAMREQLVKTDSDKIEAFKDYLRTGLQAEAWFNGLGLAEKATWIMFTTVFRTHWPPVTIAEKTKAEYKLELLEHVLKNEEVGKRTTLYDKECWSHVAWAAKALQLAMSVGIAKHTSMIWQVQCNLPAIIKDMLVEDEYKDWVEFTEAVVKINGIRLVERVEQKNLELKAL
ncbi:uncharacterized protein EDB91DRAFT_1064697 [Suillus paluster]|uniref:uncharacterized protein n=1 Tax=Suillus paluster TaxID=48578 RepID=UPI001B868072|nr:uncharacterized protein EDB91DRAFT_1064697 [Suillus paluster]KAG1720792.1 hypothetical protein EDB91DRAFT_1064697 [Suillus paluster]